MLSGFADAASDIKDSLQSMIGQLLQAKGILKEIRSSTNLLTTQSEADKLLMQQEELEKQLPAMQAIKDKPSAQGISDALVFFTKVGKHITSVSVLQTTTEKELGHKLGSSPFSLWTIAGIGILIWMLAKKKG